MDTAARPGEKKEWGDGKRTYKEGCAIDCRKWREFRIAEILYNGIKVEFRLVDSVMPYEVESDAETVAIDG